jgi:serine/threonine protein kinase
MSYICYHCFQEKPNNEICPFCGYDPAASEGKYPDALRPGSILNGKYIVGHVLGQGGFGITYIAKDYLSGERVAIKEYLPSEFARRNGSSVQAFSGDQETNFAYGKEQFLAEAKTLAAFNGDEHIVRIFSFFEENNTAYFAMEYVDGFALDKIMAQQGGRLSIAEANRYLLPLMESLNKVHAKGIVHRDIAPDNIIVTKDGSAKLIDFGAARFSTGEKSKSLDVILKHGFAPMEQYMRRGRQGPYTDVYALAVTYYYAITGKIPPDAVERVEQDSLILPSAMGVAIRKSTEKVLQKALAVSSSERFQTMAHFHTAMLETMPDYDSPECAIEPEVILKWEAQYQKAQKKQTKAKTDLDYQSAIREYEKIADFRDVKDRITECESAITAIQKQQEEERLRREEDKKRKEENRTGPGEKKKIKKGPVLAAVIFACIAFAVVLTTVIMPKQKLDRAMGLLESGDYEAAYALLEDLGNNDVITASKKERAEALLESKDYEAAYILLEGLGENDAIAASKKERAQALLASKKYEEAYVLLEETGNTEAVASSKYKRALSAINSDDLTEAFMLLNGLDYKDSGTLLNEIKHSKEWMMVCPVGESVFFGQYEQDNDLENGKEEIEWQVLAKEEDRILVISKYALDCQQYHSRYTDITWEKCTLRTWLNRAFLNAAFISEEQAMIPSVTVTADKIPFYSTDPGNSTQDQIFLLSIPEVNKYISNDTAWQCKPTEYAKAQGCYGANPNEGNCWWWLRSPGGFSTNAARVGSLGAVDVMGTSVAHDEGAVRPALWIDLKAVEQVLHINSIAYGTCGSNVKWDLDKQGVLTISGNGAMDNYSYQNKVAPWREYASRIHTLVVEPGVTRLGAYAFYSYTSLKSASIPEGIKEIPAMCFCNCSNLTDLSLPSTLTTLSNESLWRIGMKEFTIPATVTKVEGHFYGGTAKAILVDPENPSFASVDGVLFSKDLRTLIAFPYEKDTSYSIPEGTETIRGHAFAFNSKLRALTVPASVKKIETFAFYLHEGIKPALTTVIYQGTEEQWKKISIGSDNSGLLSANIKFQPKAEG